MLIKEAFFLYKMCYNFKSIKTLKDNFPYIVDLSLLKICAKFLGKITNKQVRDKRRPPREDHLSISKLLSKFYHLYIKSRSTLSLIMQIINGKNKNGQKILL